MVGLGNLIFDMDGTLIDAMTLHASIFASILHEEHGVPMSASSRAYLKTAGEPLDDQFRYVLGFATSEQPLNISHLMEQFWARVQMEPATAFADAQTGIPELANSGYRLFLVSGCSPAIVMHKMHHVGLSRCFELMLGTDRTIPYMIKGDGHLHIICEHLAITRSEFTNTSLLIGDAAYDMMFAAAAGLSAVGRVSNDNALELRWSGATFLVNDITELIQLLKHKRSGHIFRSVEELRRILS